MKNVHEMTKELVAKEMALMDSGLKMISASDLFSVDRKSLNVLLDTIEVINAANEVMVEQSRLINEMNEKLDKLLNK